jgi:dTMP kinase
MRRLDADRAEFARNGTESPRKPLFVVLEGLDGAGTTTQVGELVKALRAAGEEAHPTSEPTMGPFGSALRMHIQGRLFAKPLRRKAQQLSERSAALAFAADRLDHVDNEIEPLLKSGYTVVSDRYYLSSLAYQSRHADYGWVKEINRYALRPHLTIFLDVPVAECVRRMEGRPGLDRYERDPKELEAFLALYRSAIVDLRASGERIEEVSGVGTVRNVHARVMKALAKARRSEGVPASS